jgi:hypothetical protein
MAQPDHTEAFADGDGSSDQTNNETNRTSNDSTEGETGPEEGDFCENPGKLQAEALKGAEFGTRIRLRTDAELESMSLSDEQFAKTRTKKDRYGAEVGINIVRRDDYGQDDSPEMFHLRHNPHEERFELVEEGVVASRTVPVQVDLDALSETVDWLSVEVGRFIIE